MLERLSNILEIEGKIDVLRIGYFKNNFAITLFEKFLCYFSKIVRQALPLILRILNT